MEVEGKIVSGPGDTKCFIYLFIFYFLFLFICYLFIELFIFCNGKGVTKKSEKVTAAFDKNKSGEHKKVRTRAADSYTGVS